MLTGGNGGNAVNSSTFSTDSYLEGGNGAQKAIIVIGAVLDIAGSSFVLI